MQGYIVTGRIVTMNSERQILENGAMAVVDGRIATIGNRDDVVKQHPDLDLSDSGPSIIIPGMVDAHTHVSQSLVRGLIAHELPMIYRIYGAATYPMTTEETSVAARLCMSQLLLSGVTTVSEGCIGVEDKDIDATIDAALATGIRCNIVRGISDQTFHHAALYTQVTNHSRFDVRDGAAENDLLRTEDLLRRYPPKADGLITAGVCASSVTNYSEGYFREASRLALAHGAKMHVHASRDREEVEFSLAVFGRRPIEQLDHLGVLGPHTVIAHAILATENELVMLANANCSVAHSAAECINILNGVPNVKMMCAMGITVGLGCDNAINDMFAILKAAWLIHGATRGIQNYDPEILTADEIFAMATINGARLLGLDHIVGSLEVGKQADFVVLDADSPYLFPSQSLIAELVRYCSRAEVKEVYVAGRRVVSEGTLTGLDMQELRHSALKFGELARGRAAGKRYRSGCNC